MMNRPNLIYYGWYITAAYALILIIVVGAIFGGLGLFVLPVSQEFGLSRAEVNSAFIVSLLLRGERCAASSSRSAR